MAIDPIQSVMSGAPPHPIYTPPPLLNPAQEPQNNSEQKGLHSFKTGLSSWFSSWTSYAYGSELPAYPTRLQPVKTVLPSSTPQEKALGRSVDQARERASKSDLSLALLGGTTGKIIFRP